MYQTKYMTEPEMMPMSKDGGIDRTDHTDSCANPVEAS